jgi:hypothetical protein
MANRFPLIIDTTNGNQFAELPDGDNLLLTNSSIINALNIEAIGTVEAGQLIVNGVNFRGDYADLSNTPDIPDNILDLVNDGSTGQVLTTNGSGIVSFQNIPVQDPVVGGDLSGTAANAQINENAISVRELDVDDGTVGQVLATDGAGNLQFITVSGGGGGGGATSFLGLSGTIGLTQIEDDFITPEKLKTDGDTPGPHQYLTVNTTTGFFEYLDLPTESIDYADILNTPTIPDSITDLGIAQGAQGQLLKSDGDGTFSWVTLQNVENIEFSGTTITTTLDNSNVAINPKGNGYVNIIGTNGVVIPSGTSAQRAPNTAGAIRLNTELGIFEGYDGTNWNGMGGVRSVDGLTYIKAEENPGDSDDTLYFYTNGQESATLTSNLLEFNQNVRLKINNTETALNFDTGALSVDGGVSIRGNLLVSGTIDVDETFDTSAQVDCTMQTGELTNIVNVASDDMPYFKVGQKVMVYGASTTDDEQLDTNLTLGVARIGFTAPDGNGDETTFSYRLAQFNFATGKYSEAIDAVDLDIETSEINLFNNANNIQLTVSRQSVNHGILVYRKVASETNYKLIKVLGPKELESTLSNISWTDFYDFDLVDWAKKDSVNAFNANSGVIHFPVTAPATSGLGWYENEVDELDLDNNRVSLTNSFYANASGTIVIDDTEVIQAKIDQAKTQNRNSLVLDNRTYYVSQIVIPSDFTLEGQGDQTRIVKMPWSTVTSTGSNAIITVDTDTYDEQNNISVKHLRLDGNAQSQYLTQDTSTEYLNYAIRIFGNDILFENIELENVIAGGIYAYDSSITTGLTVLNSEIIGGGLTYVYDYSPLYASESRVVKIAHNTFQNYTDSIYVDAVQKGIVSPNVVDNCGAGIFAYGASRIILTPNVLLGPAGEFVQNPDVLNSEYDSVNIQIEPGVDFNSPNYVYQENGDLFDFTANQGRLTVLINELVKTNGVEEIGDDYSETLSQLPYAEFTNAGDATGGFAFRIVASKVSDLLSRAGYSVLYAANANTQGLVYRVIATEYVPSGAVQGNGTQNPGAAYVVTVDDTEGFTVGSIVRLVSHATTPSTAGVDGTITAINTLNSTLSIDFGDTFGDVTVAGTGGQVAIQNNFVVAKGKIN